MVAVYLAIFRAVVLKQATKTTMEAVTRIYMPTEGVWCMGLV